MTRLVCAALALVVVATVHAEEPKKKVDVGTQAPTFRFKDATGKEVDLAEHTTKGPVLLRLTCGCSGCDKELAYFQAIHDAYKGAGLTSIAVFKEPDAKMATYAKEKKINMLYAVDPNGDAWKVFDTKAMPVNYLIDKGGKILHVAAGCDPSGLLAKKVGDKAAKVINAPAVDVKAKVDAKK
jgi:peroxiredoxin